MAHNIEREMFDENDDERITTFDEVVFHVSTDPDVLEEMDFLVDLMRPIFRSYYDLIRFLAENCCVSSDDFDHNIPHLVSITEMVSRTPYTRDRVNRVTNWLMSKNAIKMSEEHSESFQVMCKSFDNVLAEVRQFVI